MGNGFIPKLFYRGRAQSFTLACTLTSGVVASSCRSPSVIDSDRCVLCKILATPRLLSMTICWLRRVPPLRLKLAVGVEKRRLVEKVRVAGKELLICVSFVSYHHNLRRRLNRLSLQMEKEQ